jgi:hypothetical protein
MNAVGMWRVGEQRGDRVLALVLLLVSAVVAISMSLGPSFESPDARDQQASLGMFAALFLWFRYAFAGGRAWMLAVDAKRAQLPGLTGRVLRIEAVRAVVFAVLPALPFAVTGALAAASSIFAITLVGLSFGVLFGVTPYRFCIVLVGGALALLIGTQSGLLAWSLPTALLAATMLTAFSVLFLRWRIATMASAPADAVVGGDYSMTEAIGRHPGSIWTAPDTSSLQAMLKAKHRGTTLSSSIALLGEPLAERLASPGRDLRNWTWTLGLTPALATGLFVSLPALDGDRITMPFIQMMFGILWPATVLMWVPFAAVAFLWLGTFRSVRVQLRPRHPVREALHLLPSMPAGPAAWRRRLQPLTLPPLAVGVLLLLSTLPWMPEGAMRALPVVMALLMAGLLWVQPTVAVTRNTALVAGAAVAAVLFALLMMAFYTLAGFLAAVNLIRMS